MKTINLKKIIEERDIDQKELASELYPQHKHPVLALKRVIKKEAELGESQISKLASLLNVGISELFETRNWKKAFFNGMHTFTNGYYKAVLCTKTWTTELFHKGSLFHTSMLSKETITLKEYFSAIEQQINNHQNESKI